MKTADKKVSKMTVLERTAIEFAVAAIKNPVPVEHKDGVYESPDAEWCVQQAKELCDELDKLRATKESLQVEPTADGWIPWNGGECPVDGDVMVEVVLKEGSVPGIYTAKNLRWEHRGNGGDIFTYRIHKPVMPAIDPNEQMTWQVDAPDQKKSH